MEELTKAQRVELVAAELSREADRLTQMMENHMLGAEVGFTVDGEVRLVVKLK